jgi:hypothetical protein
MIKLFCDYINKFNSYDFVIIGAGSSIKTYEDKIRNFIKDKKTVGINNMAHLFIPDFHVWTNNQRLRDYGSCINSNSELILGYGIKQKIIDKHKIKSFIRLEYEGNEGTQINIKDCKVFGYFRTAGCLSIMIAHYLGAKNIYVVGMDGYTLYSQEELKNKEKDHHCYGSGHTDDVSWEKCLIKDEKVYNCLRSINDYGIKFSILTPTKFKDFYDPIIFS